jgi:hypothetical protein
VFRLYNEAAKLHFYTTSDREREQAIATALYVFEGIAFFVFRTQIPETLPLYRFADSSNGGHLYTTSAAERAAALVETLPPVVNLGQPVVPHGRPQPWHAPQQPQLRYRDEGIACYVRAAAADHALPISRQLQIDDARAMPARVRGFADIHTHQFANLAFGGKAFVGAAFGPLEEALPHCDYGPGGPPLDLVHGPGGARDILGSIRMILSGLARPGLGPLAGGALGAAAGIGFGPLGGALGALFGAGIGSS